MKHNVVYDGEAATSVIVYHEGRIYVASEGHPNFPLIVDALEQGRPGHEVVDLFDTAGALAKGFAVARKIIKAVAQDAATRVVSRQQSKRASKLESKASEARDAARKVSENIDVGKVVSQAQEDEAVVPVVRGDVPAEDDDLDTLGQRELQSLAKQLGVGSGVGKTNAWLRDQIREARTQHLSNVSDRIEVDVKGGLYFDGEEVHGALADAIVAYHRQGHRDFTPLVRFLAKIMENPNPHSREHLYEWMRHLSFAIHEDGDILAYKGVDKTLARDESDPEFVSCHSYGTAKVNGVWHQGIPIPNPIGGVVEMDREKVTFDPKVGCSQGLHVGTVSFAQGYGDTMLEVKISPRDVVSVPTDNSWQKLRVCRYRVLREVSPSDARQLSQTSLAAAR